MKAALTDAHSLPYLAIAGFKNSGKTTLLCKLIRQLSDRGVRIGSLKHDGHDFEMDHKGTDTYQFQAAGAVSVMIQSSAKIAMIEHLQEKTPPSPIECIKRFREVDMVLVEGYKHEPLPKLVVARTREQLDGIEKMEYILAFCVEHSLIRDLTERVAVPVFDLDDSVGITSFVYNWWQQLIDEKGARN